MRQRWMRSILWMVLLAAFAIPAGAQRHGGGGHRGGGAHARGPRGGSRRHAAPAPRYRAPRTPRHPKTAPAPRYRSPRGPSHPKAGPGPRYRAPRIPKPRLEPKAPKAPRVTKPPPVTAGGTARDKRDRLKRNPEAKHAFEKKSGYPRGRPGYVVDHIVPLACGGADDPSNMQWQTVAEGKRKDKTERAGCPTNRRRRP